MGFNIGLHFPSSFCFVHSHKAKAESNSTQPLAPYLKTQFSVNRPLVSSGPSLHLLYSTGRRNVLSLHTTLTLYPLHDLAGLLFSVGRSIVEPTFDASEGFLFGSTLGRGEAGFQGEGVGVWALVDKGVMRQTKEKRWDLVSSAVYLGLAV